MPDSIGSAAIPRGTESGGHLQYSMFWSVSSSSPNIEESKKFIDWFVNDFDAAEILMTSRGIPVSSKVRRASDTKIDAN